MIGKDWNKPDPDGQALENTDEDESQDGEEGQISDEEASDNDKASYTGTESEGSGEEDSSEAESSEEERIEDDDDAEGIDQTSEGSYVQIAKRSRQLSLGEYSPSLFFSR
jgi:hypothetical protein